MKDKHISIVGLWYIANKFWYCMFTFANDSPFFMSLYYRICINYSHIMLQTFFTTFVKTGSKFKNWTLSFIDLELNLASEF